jgi:hypothetical protein
MKSAKADFITAAFQGLAKPTVSPVGALYEICVSRFHERRNLCSALEPLS